MTRLKARDFLFTAEERAIALLGDPPPPERRVMWTVLQYHFGEPWIHYEIQPQVSRQQVEIGLHFESSAEQSERAAQLVAREAGWLIPELGDGWELEEWTGSWRRLHHTLTFDVLTDDLAHDAAAAFARLIQKTVPVLQSTGLAKEKKVGQAENGAGRRYRGRRRRR